MNFSGYILKKYFHEFYKLVSDRTGYSWPSNLFHSARFLFKEQTIWSNDFYHSGNFSLNRHILSEDPPQLIFLRWYTYNQIFSISRIIFEINTFKIIFRNILALYRLFFNFSKIWIFNFFFRNSARICFKIRIWQTWWAQWRTTQLRDCFQNAFFIR